MLSTCFSTTSFSFWPSSVVHAYNTPSSTKNPQTFFISSKVKFKKNITQTEFGTFQPCKMKKGANAPFKGSQVVNKFEERGSRYVG